MTENERALLAAWEARSGRQKGDLVAALPLAAAARLLHLIDQRHGTITTYGPWRVGMTRTTPKNRNATKHGKS